MSMLSCCSSSNNSNQQHPKQHQPGFRGHLVETANVWKCPSVVKMLKAGEKNRLKVLAAFLQFSDSFRFPPTAQLKIETVTFFMTTNCLCFGQRL
jgi:hypothetical protein